MTDEPNEAKPQHPRCVIGWNDSLEDLAAAIATMQYDRIGDFMSMLAGEIAKQSGDDWKKGRSRLAARLRVVSHDIMMVEHGVRAAWKICKPFMPKEE